MIKCRACNHHQAPTLRSQVHQHPQLQAGRREDHGRHPGADRRDEPRRGLRPLREVLQARSISTTSTPASGWRPIRPGTHAATRSARSSPSRIAVGYIFKQLGKYQQQGLPPRLLQHGARRALHRELGAAPADEIEQCMAPHGRVPEVGKDRPVFLGLDMGQVCHLVLHTDGENGNPVRPVRADPDLPARGAPARAARDLRHRPRLRRPLPLHADRRRPAARDRGHRSCRSPTVASRRSVPHKDELA
jgi:hypothetical protein